MVAGNVVYAGGIFTTIGSQSRNRIAAIDATIGQPTGWNPNADDNRSNPAVRALVVSGNVVYAGGDFTVIGGQSRNRIAALDGTTGQATAWNPNANGSVNKVSVAGDVVYAVGFFSSIGGKLRSRLAALSTTTGQATNWNPNPSTSTLSSLNVHSIEVSGNRVFVGGEFTTID